MISLKGGIMGVVCTNKADTGSWIYFVIELAEKRAQQRVAFKILTGLFRQLATLSKNDKDSADAGLGDWSFWFSNIRTNSLLTLLRLPLPIFSRKV